MFTVYILYSKTFDRYYTGQTQNMVERLHRHNSGYEHATAPYVPWTIALTIQKPDRGEALMLERKIKNLGRERLKAFIEKYSAPK